MDASLVFIALEKFDQIKIGEYKTKYFLEFIVILIIVVMICKRIYREITEIK